MSAFARQLIPGTRCLGKRGIDSREELELRFRQFAQKSLGSGARGDWPAGGRKKRESRCDRVVTFVLGSSVRENALTCSDSLRPHQLPFLTWLILHNVSRNRARSDRERRS